MSIEVTPAQPEPHPRGEWPEPRSRAKWFVGGGFIVLGILGLAAWAFASGGASYYATPTELRAEAADGRVYRLGGRVASIDRDGDAVAFTVTDGTTDVPVVFSGEVPDTLKAETDVIATGTLDDEGTLVASDVLAKCSSKFVPAEDADEHLGRG